MLPDFTDDERYLIGSVKSEKAWTNSYMWTYLFCSLVVAGIAAYFENTPLMLAAFLVLCGFRIYEEKQQFKWLPQWRSIIRKFENAIQSKEPSPDNKQSEVEPQP